MLAALVAGGCSSVPSTRLLDALEPASCPDHEIPGEVACHVLRVAENPARPDGRRIPIFVMVLRAQGTDVEPDPLFVVAGGPGLAVTEGSFFPTFFNSVRRERDIVLVDQRGTGRSHPLALNPSEADLQIGPEMNFPPEWGRAALGRLAHEADLAQYTTARAVNDIEGVRRALGYSHINLYGTSYGTRVVQYYIKRHRAHVRSAVLKGVVPPEGNVALSYGRSPQRALERLFALCAVDAGCITAFPDLRGQLEAALTRLETLPATVEVAHPVTGKLIPFRITRGSFAFGIRSQLMNAAAIPRLPALIARAAAGDFSEWAPFLAQVRQSYASDLYGGMTFSVIASEDVPRLTEAAIRADAEGAMIGDALSRGFAELAVFWPLGEAPADLFMPLRSDVPILLVSGALDPATPPEGAESMLPGLPNARHLVFAGGAHSAANFTGLDRVIAEFIREGNASALDLSAVENNRPLPFAPDR